MLKIYGCVMITRILMVRNKDQVLKIIENHKADTALIYGKMMAAMLAKCYRSIPAQVARQFLQDVMLNKTSLSTARYGEVPLDKYENISGESIKLTREELRVSLLMNIV